MGMQHETQQNTSTSEELSRFAMDAAEQGIWVIDPADLSWLHHSPRLDQLLGHPLQQASWDWAKAQQHVHDDDRQALRDAFTRAVEVGRVSIEVRVRWSDDAVHWIAFRGRACRENAGGAVRIVGVATDITAQKAGQMHSQSEDRLRRVLAIETVGVLFFRLDGRIHDANAAFERMTGYTVDELKSGPHWKTLTPSEFWDATARAASELAQRGETTPYEKQFIRKDGSRFWGLFSPMRLSGHGLDAECMEFIIDITATKTAEAALRRSQERQAFLLKLSDALRPLSHPEDVKAAASRVLGEHLRVHRVFYAEVQGEDWIVEGRYEQGIAPMLSGRYAAQVYGPHLMDAFRAGRRVVYRDLRRDAGFTSVEREAHLALQIAAAVGVPLLKEERLVAVLVIQDAQARNWSDDDVGLVEETAERTWAAVEQAHVQAALRQSEERFRALVTARAVSVYRMSPDWGVMVQLSSEDFLASTQEPIPNWIDRYILDDDRVRVVSAINAAVATGSMFELEHRVRLADGEIGWVLSRAVPILGANGRIVEWFGTGIDVSQRKRTEEALHQSEERYRTLFNCMTEGFCTIEVLFDDAGRPHDYRFESVNPAFEHKSGLYGVVGCRRRLKSEPPCRLNFEPGAEAGF